METSLKSRRQIAMDLIDTLQDCRKRQGLSQEELAEALNVSRQTVSKWETGAALPSAENLLALSRLYGVSVDGLLTGGAGDAPPPADTAEAQSLPPDFPAPPPPPPQNLIPRRRLLLRLAAVVLLSDILLYRIDLFFELFQSSAFNLLDFQLRLLAGCVIGLCFARWDRSRPVNRRRALLIAAAALALGLYHLLCSVPLFWRLYDLVLWSGDTFEHMFNNQPNPVRHFFAWTLFDQYAFLFHMVLIACFQLGRLRFSRRAASASAPRTQAVGQT